MQFPCVQAPRTPPARPHSLSISTLLAIRAGRDTAGRGQEHCQGSPLSHGVCARGERNLDIQRNLSSPHPSAGVKLSLHEPSSTYLSLPLPDSIELSKREMRSELQTLGAQTAITNEAVVIVMHEYTATLLPVKTRVFGATGVELDTIDAVLLIFKGTELRAPSLALHHL